MLDFLAYGSIADLFQVADDLTSLYFENKENCGEYDLLYAVRDRCSGQDCGIQQLAKNLFVTNLIETLGDFSVLLDSIFKF